MRQKIIQLTKQPILMKHLTYIIIVSSLLFLQSCSPSAESYLADFNTFITEIETTADEMTNDEWLAAEKRYNLFIKEDFEKVKQKLSSDDMQQIGKLKGRFNILIYKKEAIDLLEEGKNALIEAKGAVDGVMEGMEN
jgi:hypothetical protein